MINLDYSPFAPKHFFHDVENIFFDERVRERERESHLDFFLNWGHDKLIGESIIYKEEEEDTWLHWYVQSIGYGSQNGKHLRAISMALARATIVNCLYIYYMNGVWLQVLVQR